MYKKLSICFALGTALMLLSMTATAEAIHITLGDDIKQDLSYALHGLYYNKNLACVLSNNSNSYSSLSGNSNGTLL